PLSLGSAMTAAPSRVNLGLSGLPLGSLQEQAAARTVAAAAARKRELRLMGYLFSDRGPTRSLSGQEDVRAIRIGSVAACAPQKRPTVWPLASRPIECAAGTRGRPGSVLMLPMYATTKPAPRRCRRSVTVTSKSRGRPRSFGSSERL